MGAGVGIEEGGLGSATELVPSAGAGRGEIAAVLLVTRTVARGVGSSDVASDCAWVGMSPDVCGLEGGIEGGGDSAASVTAGAVDCSGKTGAGASGSFDALSTEGTGMSCTEEGTGGCDSLSMLGLTDGAFDGGAVVGLRTGARGLKLAAPFFFKRVLIAQKYTWVEYT